MIVQKLAKYLKRKKINYLYIFVSVDLNLLYLINIVKIYIKML